MFPDTAFPRLLCDDLKNSLKIWDLYTCSAYFPFPRISPPPQNWKTIFSDPEIQAKPHNTNWPVPQLINKTGQEFSTQTIRLPGNNCRLSCRELRIRSVRILLCHIPDTVVPPGENLQTLREEYDLLLCSGKNPRSLNSLHRMIRPYYTIALLTSRRPIPPETDSLTNLLYIDTAATSIHRFSIRRNGMVTLRQPD